MTLVELRYVAVLAQEQHFGRAANLCGVSQPALSTAIKKLEEELDVVLFERSRSSVQATFLGNQIIAQAQQVLASSATIQAIADAGNDQLSTPLSVGAIFTVGPYLLPQSVPHLRKLAPRMALRMEEDYTVSLRQKLRDGELDAIVVSMPFAEMDVVTRELFDEPFVVLMPQKHPLAAHTEVDPLQMKGQNLLLLGEDHCLHGQILAAFPKLQPPLATGDTIEMLRNMVANDLGITILPLSVAVSLCSGSTTLVARPFMGSMAGRSLALAWRASYPRHKAIDVLCQAMRSSSVAYGFYTTDQETNRQGLLVENSHW